MTLTNEQRIALAERALEEGRVKRGGHTGCLVEWQHFDPNGMSSVGQQPIWMGYDPQEAA